MGAGLNVDRIACRLQLAQSALEPCDFGRGGALAENAVGFAGNGSKRPAQPRQPGAGREQELAEIAAAVENGIAAILQRLVVEREHQPIGLAAQAGERAAEQRLADRPAGRIPQRAAALLQAPEFMELSVEFQRRADLHRTIAVQEAVAAALLDAVEQV